MSSAGDSTHFCFSRSLFGITSSGVHVSCSQRNNIRSWTRIWPGHRPLICIPSGHCIPRSHTTHRVHKRDAKDVIAEEEQLLLHQTPLVIYLDLLWQGAERQGEVHPGVGRKVQGYSIPVVLAPDLQPGLLLNMAAGKEVTFPILSELPCGQALGRWQLSRDTCVPSAGGSVGAASLPLLQLVWGRDSHAYHIPDLAILKPNPLLFKQFHFTCGKVQQRWAQILLKKIAHLPFTAPSLRKGSMCASHPASLGLDIGPAMFFSFSAIFQLVWP